MSIAALASALSAAVAGADHPAAETRPATDVGTGAATLNGLLTFDERTVYRFEYGPTAAYGLSTPGVPVPRPPGDDGEGPGPPRTPVSARVDGLAAATTYHFRLVAATGRHGRPALGGDLTFTTVAVAAQGQPLGAPPPAPLPVVPTAPTPAPGPAPAALAPPVLGKTVAVEVRSGAVAVRTPGSAGAVALTADASIPVGTILDTRNGAIALRSALPGGGTQTGVFHGGVFQVRQSASARGLVELVLRGTPPACGRAGGRAAQAKARRRKPPRALWGRDDHGRYRTRGGSSVTTTRGTAWFVEDRCAGTLTRVSAGSVTVRDLRRRRTVVVRAGHSYLARASR